MAKRDSEKTEPHEYGPWMRALPYNPGKSPFVVVPGIGDGLGGVPKPTQRSNHGKSTETVINSAGEEQVRYGSGKKDGAEHNNAEKWETSDSREQTSLNGQESRNPLSEVSISNSNLTTCLTNNAAFEAQIQELDLEINKFDKQEARVEIDSIVAPLATPTNEKRPTPSMQNLEAQDQAHHMMDNSLPFVQGSKTLRTWKRLARDNPMETDPPQIPTAKKRNKEEEVEYLPELPVKKSQVSKGESKQNLMAEAAQQSRQAQ